MPKFLPVTLFGAMSCCAVWASVAGFGSGTSAPPPKASGSDPIVGTPTPGVGNCYPFSCGPSDGRTAYQQVYSSAAFTGPIDIGDLEFYKSLCITAGCAMDSDTFSVYLSYSANPVDGLSDVSTSANIGADYSYFGTYSLGPTMPNTTTLNGAPFLYNPALGDLLMTVYVTQPPTGPTVGYNAFYQVDLTGTVTSRAYFGGPGGNGADSDGLVTGFSPAVATPEPASILLLAGIAGLAGYGLRRKARGSRV